MPEQKNKSNQSKKSNNQQPKRSRWSWLYYVVVIGLLFFFFNPFSDRVLRKVMDRILWSWYENPRKMRLFFYYPNDEYLVYLMTMYALHFVEELDCRDLFPGKDERERILIFELT